MLIRRAFTLACVAGVSVKDKAAIHGYLAALGRPLGHGLYELRRGSGVSALEINRAGIVRVNRRHLLEIDYGTTQGLAGWRPHRRLERCIHLWSQRWLGYYHWLIDVAPKICAAQEVYGRDLGGFKLCWPRVNRSYEDEILALLEVPTDAIIDTQVSGGLSAETLACVPIPWWEQPPHPNIHLLRARLAQHLTEPNGSRIFITRTGKRACENQSEMLDLLARYGFEPVDFEGMSVREQIRRVSSAAAVGGIHGAGLSNVLWCRPETDVIDLMPPHYQPAWFANLSAALGLRYYRIEAQPGGSHKAHWTQMHDSFSVDLAALRRSLDAIF